MTESMDQRLKAWAEAHRPTDEHLDALAQRVHDDVVRERIRTAPHPRHAHVPHLFYAVAGAVAALLAVVLWFSVHSTIGTPQAAAKAAPPAFTAVSPERIAAAARLAREMTRLFGDEWRWVAESSGDIRVGVEPLPGGIGSSPRPMLLRISILARDTRRAEWKPVWQSEVLMRSEDVVRVQSDPAQGNQLAFWILPLANGTLHVDVDVSLAYPSSISSRKTLIVQDGDSTELFTFRDGTTEYRVQQTVKLLGVKGEGST